MTGKIDMPAFEMLRGYGGRLAAMSDGAFGGDTLFSEKCWCALGVFCNLAKAIG
jgi:hypothetical protein